MTQAQFLRKFRKIAKTFRITTKTGFIRQRRTECCPIEAVAGTLSGTVGTASIRLRLDERLKSKIIGAADRPESFIKQDIRIYSYLPSVVKLDKEVLAMRKKLMAIIEEERA